MRMSPSFWWGINRTWRTGDRWAQMRPRVELSSGACATWKHPPKPAPTSTRSVFCDKAWPETLERETERGDAQKTNFSSRLKGQWFCLIPKQSHVKMLHATSQPRSNSLETNSDLALALGLRVIILDLKLGSLSHWNRCRIWILPTLFLDWKGKEKSDRRSFSFYVTMWQSHNSRFSAIWLEISSSLCKLLTTWYSDKSKCLDLVNVPYLS